MDEESKQKFAELIGKLVAVGSESDSLPEIIAYASGIAAGRQIERAQASKGG